MFINIILMFFLMYGLEYKKNIPFLYTFTIVMSLSMLFFFCATLFGFLYIAKIFWIFSAIIVFITALYANNANKISLFSHRHYAFLLAMGVVFLLFYNGRIMGWDAFFWAEFGKYIHVTNEFWSANSAIFHSPQHQSYVPGYALLSSLFMGLFPYKEYSDYLAFGTPLICMILTVVKLSGDYFYPNKYVKFFAAMFCFGLVKTLGAVHPLNFLSADIGIAALFSTCLLVAMFEKNISLGMMFLTITLPAFTLLKSTNILFSMTVILVFFVRICTFNRKEIIFSLSRGAALVIIAAIPLLAWDYSLAVRGILSTLSHLNLSKVLYCFDQPSPIIIRTLNDTINYFFFKPLIVIYPEILQPLVSSFAFLIYSSLLFVLSYRKCRGRQLAYLICLLCATVGWLMVYVLLVTVVLPDAPASYMARVTYLRYVGAFICPVFLISIFTYITSFDQALVCSKLKYFKAISIVVAAILPLYALGIYQRAHPPIRHQGPLLSLSLFQEGKEERWEKLDASQRFIIQNTPVNSRIWMLLDETTMGYNHPPYRFFGYLQIGFHLRPYRDHHLPVNIEPGLSSIETKRALIKNGVTHIFLLAPNHHPLQEFGDFISLPKTNCPILINITPWKENIEADVETIVFEDAWWCS